MRLNSEVSAQHPLAGKGCDLTYIPDLHSQSGMHVSPSHSYQVPDYLQHVLSKPNVSSNTDMRHSFDTGIMGQHWINIGPKFGECVMFLGTSMTI